MGVLVNVTCFSTQASDILVIKRKTIREMIGARKGGGRIKWVGYWG